MPRNGEHREVAEEVFRARKERNRTIEDNPIMSSRVPLAQGIEEGIEPPEVHEPDVLLKGKVHHIFAGAGKGKTWLSLWLIKSAIERGERVILFDCENGKRIVSERLQELDIDTTRLDELLLYIPYPNLALTVETTRAYHELLDDFQPHLIVFDSWINFLSVAGLSENENTDVSTWATSYTHPARKRGVTTALLDHVPHEGNRHRGATRKKDEADVQWSLSNPQPFDRSRVGEIVLFREKDREGWLPPSVKFSIGGTADGFILERSAGTLDVGLTTETMAPSRRKVYTHCKEKGDEGATWKELLQLLDGSKSTLSRTITELTQWNLIYKRANRYYAHHPVEPESPTNKRYTEGSTRFHNGSTEPMEPDTTRQGSTGSTLLKGGTVEPGVENRNRVGKCKHGTEGGCHLCEERVEKAIREGMSPKQAWKDELLGGGA